MAQADAGRPGPGHQPVGGRTDVGTDGRVHRVGPLDSPDGGQALLDLAPGAGNVSQAAGLSSRLGGLPLALHQAGTYLASPFAAQRTFESYAQVLEERFAELLGRGDDDRARVTGTWEVSLAALDARGCPQARLLLRLLSCFAAATPIPPGLLDLDALGRYCGGLAEAEDGLAGLLATGLIDVRDGPSGSPPSVVIHPLVAEMTRRQAGVSLDASFAQAAGLMGAAVGHLDIEDPADRPGWQAVLPHLRFLFTIKTNATEPLLARLAGNAARATAALSWTGSYLAAFELADTALERMAEPWIMTAASFWAQVPASDRCPVPGTRRRGGNRTQGSPRRPPADPRSRSPGHADRRALRRRGRGRPGLPR